MYNNQTVSVIVPVYFAEKFISQTLESILNQTYRDVEIICVDDCSKDNSAQIINEFLNKNQNVCYYRQKKNMGAAVARNIGLDLAHGRYVAFLDSDDLWKKQKLEQQITFMERNKVAFCYTAIEMIDENGKMLKTKRKIPLIINYKALLRNTAIATSSVVIDRNILGDFKMPMRRSGQDYATWLMLLRQGTEAHGIDVPLVQYRKLKTSLSSNKIKSIGQVWKIQHEDENIPAFQCSINTISFVFNALKKHFF